MTPHSSLRSVIKNNIYRFLAPLLKPVYGGIGSILMLHRITDGFPGPRIDRCRRLLEMSPRGLDRTITDLRKRGYTFVSLDEVHDILRRPRKVSRFAAVTIDDGYVDTYKTAFPLLTAAGVPFTLYLTTGIPDKTVIPWTYLLERHLCHKKRITFEHGSHHCDYLLHDQVQRESAFWDIRSLFENLSVDDIGRLSRDLFGEDEVGRMIDELSISWKEIEEMSQHSLVTIGAHTINHPNLRNIDREEAREELIGAKNIIESRLNTGVCHCSFPFGSEACCGDREFELARECGFDTATTTRLANLFPEHGNGLHSLPRIYGADSHELNQALSGIVSAFRYRGQRVVME